MAQEATIELQAAERTTARRPAWRRILGTARAHPLGAVGLFCVLLFFFCAIFADAVMPSDPEQVGAGAIKESPSLAHPFGTDRLGHDVLSRTIFGARIAMVVGMLSVILGISVGSFFGIVSGYLGGLVDAIIQRAVDMLLAFPIVVLLLAIIAVIGDETSPVRNFLRDYTPIPQDEFWNVPTFLDVVVISVAIGVGVAVGTTRVVRGAVLSLKENVYIEAARAMGASDRRIMLKHIFPNVAALVVVLATIFLPLAILAEAAISFLGIGLPSGTPSWGADVGDGNNRGDAINRGIWWVVFFPGLALSIVVLGFNLLGDTFRDISDPRLRGSGLGGGAGGGRGGGL